MRRQLGASPKNDREAQELYFAVSELLQKGERLVADAETLGEVLALAPEVEAYRGKGSQSGAWEFASSVARLSYRAKERLPPSKKDPDSFPKEDELSAAAGDALKCLCMLSDHFFERVRGPRVRSRHVAKLRALAWQGLGRITGICRRPEHLAHALTVAANPRAADYEREAAVDFLVEYWGADAPDKATVQVLRELESEAVSRRMLVGVMQAQINLGLNDEFGALIAVEDWDEENE